jgi:multidrug efflux pump subunit AcrB
MRKYDKSGPIKEEDFTFKKVATSTNYVIAYGLENFKKMTDIEIHKEKYLDDQLEKIDGILKIEYNGHFGPNIFIEVDNDYDNLVLWSRVDRILRKFVE